VGALNGLIEELVESSTPKKQAIEKVTVAGNTVMEHIFLGISPEPLGRAPYKPAFKESRELNASEAGLDLGPRATLYTFPVIGGFVGGDTVAVILSLGLHKDKKHEKDKKRAERALALDIGTNSEIVLSTPEALFCASSPAGPAFEGGEIKDGMRARNGAIQGVNLEGDRIRLDTIGTSSPKGICGSGLVDAASVLIKAGVIEPSGRIRSSQEVSTNLSYHIKEGKCANSFVLYRDTRGEISLTQDDIRALQVAKAALRAGINVVLKKAKLEPRNIDRVYIAGAFGSNLDKAGLSAIGVLDRVWLDKVTPVGDAALDGARLALASDDKRTEAEEIARSAKYVPLSGSAYFEREFLANMNF
jgi:uncharacterized 2Fe-2S/4Fe-4S cluster protein (DUF4445 family)